MTQPVPQILAKRAPGLRGPAGMVHPQDPHPSQVTNTIPSPVPEVGKQAMFLTEQPDVNDLVRAAMLGAAAGIKTAASEDCEGEKCCPQCKKPEDKCSCPKHAHVDTETALKLAAAADDAAAYLLKVATEVGQGPGAMHVTETMQAPPGASHNLGGAGHNVMHVAPLQDGNAMQTHEMSPSSKGGIKERIMGLYNNLTRQKAASEAPVDAIRKLANDGELQALLAQLTPEQQQQLIEAAMAQQGGAPGGQASGEGGADPAAAALAQMLSGQQAQQGGGEKVAQAALELGKWCETELGKGIEGDANIKMAMDLVTRLPEEQKALFWEHTRAGGFAVPEGEKVAGLDVLSWASQHGGLQKIALYLHGATQLCKMAEDPEQAAMMEAVMQAPPEQRETLLHAILSGAAKGGLAGAGMGGLGGGGAGALLGPTLGGSMGAGALHGAPRGALAVGAGGALLGGAAGGIRHALGGGEPKMAGVPIDAIRKLAAGPGEGPGATGVSHSGQAAGQPVAGRPQGATGLVSSNQAAIDATARAAAAPEKKEMAGVTSQPMQSASKDPVLKNNLAHTDGSKLASAVSSEALQLQAGRALLSKLIQG